MKKEDMNQLIVEVADKIYLKYDDEISLAMANASATMFNVFEKILANVVCEVMNQADDVSSEK